MANVTREGSVKKVIKAIIAIVNEALADIYPELRLILSLELTQDTEQDEPKILKCLLRSTLTKSRLSMSAKTVKLLALKIWRLLDFVMKFSRPAEPHETGNE